MIKHGDGHFVAVGAAAFERGLCEFDRGVDGQAALGDEALRAGSARGNYYTANAAANAAAISALAANVLAMVV